MTEDTVKSARDALKRAEALNKNIFLIILSCLTLSGCKEPKNTHYAIKYADGLETGFCHHFGAKYESYNDPVLMRGFNAHDLKPEDMAEHINVRIFSSEAACEDFDKKEEFFND